MTNIYRWQVPGNGNPFDTTLEDWKNPNRFMSQRSIGVLEYFNNNLIVFKDKFETNIKDYLYNTFKHKINNSCVSHFYRPLEFLGLIRNINNNLSLSIDGKNFLNEIFNENYDKALDFYILQMLKTKYPNTATKGIKLNLFPFRILFKLLLEYKSVNKNWFKTKIPYIKTIDDIDNIKNINGEEYSKWITWVIPYLIKFNILSEMNDNIGIAKEKFGYIKSFIDAMEYEDMFFDNSISEIYLTNNIKKQHIKRNNSLINEIIQENNCMCFFNKEHITFETIIRNNYVEGHHIIPISLQDSFPNFNLDVKSNIIPLCPNCHKAIHLSTNQYKNILLEKIITNTKIKESFNINLEDLKEIYFSKFA
jgi:5-methylcytosine-specific restriction protein A